MTEMQTEIWGTTERQKTDGDRIERFCETKMGAVALLDDTLLTWRGDTISVENPGGSVNHKLPFVLSELAKHGVVASVKSNEGAVAILSVSSDGGFEHF